MAARTQEDCWGAADPAASMSVTHALSAGLYLLGQETLSGSLLPINIPFVLSLHWIGSEPTIEIQHKHSNKHHLWI